MEKELKELQILENLLQVKKTELISVESQIRYCDNEENKFAYTLRIAELRGGIDFLRIKINEML